MTQAAAYKFVNEVNRLADQVGADHARDVLRVYLAEQGDKPLDVTAETVPTQPENADAAGEVNAACGPNDTITAELDALGADRLVGRVSRLKESYSVKVRWQLMDGTQVFEDSLTTGTTGTFNLDEQAVAPKAEVVVEDTSGNSKKATYSLHMR